MASVRLVAADPDDVWVGLDVGTQSARAFAVAGDGTVLGSGSVTLRSHREGSRHEQDPRDWWDAAAGASLEALAGIAADRVRGVAACATSGTILLVDAGGAPLTPGLMYDDRRASEQAARIARAGGLAGRRISPEWGLPKLLWMLDAWPGIEQGARLAQQADVITRALVGHDVPSDSSHTLKSGYDVERESWPQYALHALGMPREVLPDVVRAGTRLGEVCETAARQTGIPAGTAVVAGMTDGCAAQFAAGALREGDWNSVLGTTLVLKGCSSRRIEDPGGVLYSHRAPDGRWLPGGASSAGAGVLTQRFADSDLDELGERAAQHEDTRVLAYPLVSRGERFPFAAPNAQAFVIGEPASEAELFAALLQGVAFVERLCFDLLERLGAPADGELTLTGGATRSRRWCQLRADVLGRPVRLVEQPEAAVGMAVLAASAVGGAELAATADAMVRTRECIEPRTDRFEALMERYRRFVGELEGRGWLDGSLAEHARTRAGARDVG
jgi:sugar (pentulose or hexulose) kinase